MDQFPSSDQQAQQLRGLLRVVNDLGTATDQIFKRIYGSLSRRRKTLVDTEALRRAQAHARALQRRARAQGLEIARVTAILATIDEGVVMQDPQGRIILMNEAARQLLGGIKAFWDSPLGRMFMDTNDPEPPPETRAGSIDPIGQPQRVTLSENGTKEVGVRLARAYASQGYLLGTIMVLSDVTSQNLGERLKTSFITQMSHELRTPLTSIKGMSDVLLNIPEGQPPNRRFLEAIGRNVAILDRMIVEMLDLSEIEGRTFEPRQDPLMLDEQLFTILQGMEPDLKKAQLSLTMMVAKPLQIIGDTRRIQWAVGHLIENAVQYTPPGGEILVMMRQQDANALIIVQDTGVGIREQDLPHLFERFYRGEARTPDGKIIDPRGLGQGLYIANAVAEGHGGHLTVHSTVRSGSTFTMTLPIQGLALNS